MSATLEASGSDPMRALRLQRGLAWLVAIGLGGLQAWVGRNVIGADGVSYLDVADAYLAGDWAQAINSYWSPLYSWLLGGASAVTGIGPRHELELVHAVNFAIYGFTLASFEFFLAGLIRRGADGGETDETIPSPAALFWIGHAVFLWSSLHLITVALVTPDLLLAGFVYLAGGLIVRLQSGREGIGLFAALGLVLGLGYLAKAPLFLLAFGFIAAATWIASRGRLALGPALVSLGCFALVAGPFIVAISIATGKPTFGDSGRLNYAWYVSGTESRHWQGAPPETGTAAHPTRQIHVEPRIFEFGSPRGGTYPAWYDPAYWNEGVRFRFIPSLQAARLYISARSYGKLFLDPDVLTPFREHRVARLTALLLFGLGASLVLAGGVAANVRKIVIAEWPLVGIGCAGLVMFSLVFFEARHIAPYLALSLIGGFAGALRAPALGSPRLLRTLGLATWGFCVLGVLYDVPDFPKRAPMQAPYQVAEALHRAGLRPGDPVATLRYANKTHTRWARLARLRIVAEVFDHDQQDGAYWTADETTRKDMLAAIRRSGARAIVSQRSPDPQATADWQRVDDSDYYVLFLDAEADDAGGVAAQADARRPPASR